MRPHPDKARLDALMPAVREYQALASAHGIGDVFQDNGGKLLQLVLTLGLTVAPGRGGVDAFDSAGNAYELKSVNLSLGSSFTTHHHLNPTILAYYRSVAWLFAIYRGIELACIYRMHPDQLEPVFAQWERKLQTQPHINNPKIPAAFVADNGELLFGLRPQVGLRAAQPPTPKPPVDPFRADD